jgi:hypothetical protein
MMSEIDDRQEERLAKLEAQNISLQVSTATLMLSQQHLSNSIDKLDESVMLLTENMNKAKGGLAAILFAAGLVSALVSWAVSVFGR